LLLGAAGLLPLLVKEKIPQDAWLKKLGYYWQSSSRPGVITDSNWNFFKVRPGNHPARRLAAMSYLLYRYKDRGLLDGLTSVFSNTPEANCHLFLENALIVESTGYWRPGASSGTAADSRAPALLGKERVGEIIINVLLPFVFARGTTEQRDKALRLFREYPAAAENGLVRHMRRQLSIDRKSVNTVRLQQGLLRIYKTCCMEGRCQDCPLIRTD
jgi:hypothetical protein